MSRLREPDGAPHYDFPEILSREKMELIYKLVLPQAAQLITIIITLVSSRSGSRYYVDGIRANSRLSSPEPVVSSSAECFGDEDANLYDCLRMTCRLDRDDDVMCLRALKISYIYHGE